MTKKIELTEDEFLEKVLSHPNFSATLSAVAVLKELGFEFKKPTIKPVRGAYLTEDTERVPRMRIVTVAGIMLQFYACGWSSINTGVWWFEGEDFDPADALIAWVP